MRGFDCGFQSFKYILSVRLTHTWLNGILMTRQFRKQCMHFFGKVWASFNRNYLHCKVKETHRFLNPAHCNVCFFWFWREGEDRCLTSLFVVLRPETVDLKADFFFQTLDIFRFSGFSQKILLSKCMNSFPCCAPNHEDFQNWKDSQYFPHNRWALQIFLCGIPGWFWVRGLGRAGKLKEGKVKDVSGFPTGWTLFLLCSSPGFWSLWQWSHTVYKPIRARVLSEDWQSLYLSFS